MTLKLTNQQRRDLFLKGFTEHMGDRYKKVAYGYVKPEKLHEDQILADNGVQPVVLEKMPEEKFVQPFTRESRILESKC